MPERADIWSLVEHAAAERGLPRLELWQTAARAMEKGDLKIEYEQKFPRTPVYPPWITGFRQSVERYNDPSGCAHLLKLITVSVPHFHTWLRSAYKLRRGPARGTTGYQEADRKLFPEISRLIDSGARSPHGAALKLVDEGKVAGEGADRESKARRLSRLYRKECLGRTR
jgi:hypothetical protein